jgi:hypothetical protein
VHLEVRLEERNNKIRGEARKNVEDKNKIRLGGENMLKKNKIRSEERKNKN